MPAPPAPPDAVPPSAPAARLGDLRVPWPRPPARCSELPPAHPFGGQRPPRCAAPRGSRPTTRRGVAPPSRPGQRGGQVTENVVGGTAVYFFLAPGVAFERWSARHP